MSSTEMIDYRRTDLRTSVLETPYWITSGEMSYSDSDDLAAVMFSFPAAVYTRGPVLLMAMCFQVTTLGNSGTPVLTVGQGSLATEDVTTGGNMTDIDVDYYIVDTDITEETVGYYFSPASDYVTAVAAQTWASIDVITPADATVPCIMVITTGGTINNGNGRLHILITELPGV